MRGAPPVPREIRRLGVQSVAIVWDEEHRAEYPNRYLRDHCPCAECREGAHGELVVVGQKEEVYPVRIGLVGRYAVSVEWSDGHDTGIYSYETLLGLCPCERCRPDRGETR